jgi:hypothetical protein
MDLNYLLYHRQVSLIRADAARSPVRRAEYAEAADRLGVLISHYRERRIEPSPVQQVPMRSL